MSSSKFAISAVVVVLLAWTLTFISGLAAAQQTPGDVPAGVGTLEDYAATTSSIQSYGVPELGLEVRDGVGRLRNGQRLRGVDVVQLLEEGPAARAGVKGSHTIVKQLASGVLAVGSVFFPPALLVAVAVGQSNLGEVHDTIIAVDSKRTRNGQEFSDAMSKAVAGKLVYLSIIHGGRREQIRVELNDVGAPYLK